MRFQIASKGILGPVKVILAAEKVGFLKKVKIKKAISWEIFML